jgi:hypothetical protein
MLLLARRMMHVMSLSLCSAHLPAAAAAAAAISQLQPTDLLHPQLRLRFSQQQQQQQQ